MLYKPKFCCQCAEKIDAVKRKFWSSGRFCELCQTEFGLHDLLPRIFGGILIVFGLYGVGNFFSKPEKHPAFAPNQIAGLNVRSEMPQSRTVAQVSPVGSVQQTTRTENSGAQTDAPSALPKADLKVEKAAAPLETAEKVYFCGAPTKKGTMCSRRMKNGGRCWQHEGQAAMMPQEKLLAVRRN